MGGVGVRTLRAAERCSAAFGLARWRRPEHAGGQQHVVLIKPTQHQPGEHSATMMFAAAAAAAAAMISSTLSQNLFGGLNTCHLISSIETVFFALKLDWANTHRRTIGSVLSKSGKSGIYR